MAPYRVRGRPIHDSGVIEMATRRMVRCRFQHTRGDRGTGAPARGAARLEAAGRRPVCGLRYHAVQRCQVNATPVTTWETGKEPARVRMARLLKQLRSG